MNLIVSVDENWGIGKNNHLLFSLKEDMEFFKEKTIGKTVIMGRKTLDSLPMGKPLKNRVNIVLTRERGFERNGVIACHSVAEAMEKIKNSDDAFVIGGGEIYRRFLPFCDTAYVTKYPHSADADTFMVNLDDSREWEAEKTEKRAGFEICKYIRKK